MSNPSEGIRDLLVAAGIGVFADQSDWGIYISKQPDNPEAVVTIYDSGGTASNPQFAVDFPSVQVRVRGRPNGYIEARNKCVDIKNALLGLPSQDLNGDRWVSISMIGDINALGYDQNQRPMLTTNYSLIIEPTSTGNREAL